MKVWSFDHAMNLTIKISDGFESGIGLFCRIQKPDFTILVMGLSLESDALEGLGPGFFIRTRTRVHKSETLPITN